MQVVWFKRDLRIRDHEPLLRASKCDLCLCLYVYEPDLINSDEFDVSHLDFINESLAELESKLRQVGGRLTLRVGSVPEILAELHRKTPIETLWSHEETGNRITYDRDRLVKRWAVQTGVVWTELPQNGVVRRLKSRDGWSKQRESFLKQPQATTPTRLRPPSDIDHGRLHRPEDFGMKASSKTGLQRGGESEAENTLQSFLQERGQDYSSEMSSPVTATVSCSRLSTHLAWGCLSMKRVTHELRDRQAQLRELKAVGEPIGGWLKSLRAFESRLSWHCHFMQKLEDEPSIEFENMSRVYDGMREDSFDQALFDSWCQGATGYPMVDACMRALHRHSWINFRMRAMLVSFASYHLWLHWRPTAVYMARHFLDFEPGIHFSQFQMQSGTTGINTVRIYSPIKQVKDQDPNGRFIREYVPELARVPDEYLPEPHKMPLSMQAKIGCVLGKDYPAPIVDHPTAYRTARERIYAIRRKDEARLEAQSVVKKHGSRKGGAKKTTSTRRSKAT